MLSDWFSRVFSANDFKSSQEKSDGTFDEVPTTQAGQEDGGLSVAKGEETGSRAVGEREMPIFRDETDVGDSAERLEEIHIHPVSSAPEVDTLILSQRGNIDAIQISNSTPQPNGAGIVANPTIARSLSSRPVEVDSIEQLQSLPTSAKTSLLSSRRNFFGAFFSKPETPREVKEEQVMNEVDGPKLVVGKSCSGESDGSEEVNLFTDPSHIEDNRKPVLDDFSMIRVLGKGSYGKVVLVRKKSSQVLYAMKVLKKNDVVRKRQVERTKIERRVLGFIDHPFLMKLHFAFQTGNKLYLVLDYCPGGELFFHLSRYKRFPEGVVRFYAAELVLALKHLHDGGIIYRDIKPENILLDSEGHIKLGDFGLAKDNITEAAFGAFSVCGTPEYMAPEVINKDGHGTCVDWWGLGMLMYEMLTGLPPWYTKDRQKLFERLRVAPLVFPKTVSPMSATIIQGLLTRNPNRRLGARGGQEVMDHEFFYGLDWDGLLSKRIPAPLNPCRNYSLNSESTHNFDPQFTRLPIDTIAQPESNPGPSPGTELNFDGFTYNDPCALYVADNAMRA